MCTIIGKQLSHTDRQFRHIGVIGGVMMVAQLAQKMSVTIYGHVTVM